MNRFAGLTKQLISPFNVFALLLALLSFGVRAVVARSSGPSLDPSILATSDDPKVRELRIFLYFASTDASSFAREQRSFTFSPNTLQAAARAVVGEWFAGPRFSGALRTVSGDLPLPVVFVRSGEVVLDFASVWQTAPFSTASEMFTVCGLANSLLELEGVNAVRILVAGTVAPTFAGHVSIERPLQRSNCRGTS